jgi:hypothetical protein
MVYIWVLAVLARLSLLLVILVAFLGLISLAFAFLVWVRSATIQDTSSLSLLVFVSSLVGDIFDQRRKGKTS